MDREQFVKIVLEKRFGEVTPEDIPCLLEVNTFLPADGDENAMGIGVQLVISVEMNVIKEDYQVSEGGVVYSWGSAPVIDDRSLVQKL